MSSDEKKISVERTALLPKLARLETETARKNFLDANRALVRADVVEWLTEVVRQQARINVHETLVIADFTVDLARRLTNPSALAQSLRAKANALYIAGQHREAINHHEQAMKIFRRQGQASELARTLSSSIQPHLLLGEYQQALQASEEARRIFLAERNHWRLARLELNAGNILHRQDRLQEALERYEHAYRYFLPNRQKDPEGVAVALHNMAMCLISLNDFRRAMDVYQEARQFSEQHNMPLLVSQADYNIAWLYYLRGDYSIAIDRLRSTRETCRKSGDNYHFALCHLDLSEIYLELNLAEEAAEIAQAGISLFEKQGMGYEKAKCMANLAIAYGQQGKAVHALEMFARARETFVAEQNQVWPSLIDLYQALVLFNEGRYFESRRLCQSALEFFQTSPLIGKAVLCRLLMARLQISVSDLASAERECLEAEALLQRIESPNLKYQVHVLLGQIFSLSNRPEQSYSAYQQARVALEVLRSSLRGEELKMAFMKNRLEVYEGLVDLCLLDPSPARTEEAFQYIEQAKSRSLVDLMSRLGSRASAPHESQSDLVRQIGRLREELNWYYHRIENEQLQGAESTSARIDELQVLARQHEAEFVRVLRELPTAEAESVGAPAVSCSIAEIRAQLPPDSILLEYYRVKDQILVAVLWNDDLQIVPITLTTRVQKSMRLLQFQLAKFRFGREYVKNFEQPLLEATQAHLRDLYKELIAPVRPLLHAAKHLVIVPHEFLHYIPFQALMDEDEYLIDCFTLSNAPSATVFAKCQARTFDDQHGALIMGVPDAAAPFIQQEAEAIASTMPDSNLLIGPQATAAALRTLGLSSRIIHIATHGFFRQDNPLFSGIKLGDSVLSLYDLYQYRLPAELITLSGCATGLNVVTGGDELLGLVRGLFAAGAGSLLLSLWDVDDESTADFMASFYGRRLKGMSYPAALQGINDLRKKHPHPYYWAPFVLTGRI
ncbi:MAG: repeat-containing protein [Candidatus Angelobacter sp.]|jgi:CHAT domain-containing protein/tetratricopeptide (TPR) repeat protein|nr:repeat-containing protein [Candidatus Angelobacter sp.]